MKKTKFIQLAASLGIVIPACLLGNVEKCEASDIKTSLPKMRIGESQEVNNPIKDRIMNVFNYEEQTPAQKIAHTNVHANYTVPHTNVHSNFRVGNRHTDSHSNTPKKHTNSHSNSRV